MKRLIGFLVLMATWSTFSPVLAQEDEDITGAIEKYRALVTLANQKLEDLDLPEALARFTEVIDGYNSGKLSSTTPLTRQIVGQAYEGRARTYANLGRNAEAEADYETLIRFDVTWPVDRTRTSPKIVALYDKVYKKVVGTLTVKSEPPGALVSLNGVAIGRSPVDKDLPAGTYKLSIEAEGYDPISEQFTLAGGARLEKTPHLRANARDLLVASSPPGAKVTLDGVEKGTTFGSAGVEYTEVAARLSVSLTDISAPLKVGHVAPGSHLLRVEKECFEPQTLSITVALDPNDVSAVRYEPIKLTPSTGSVALDSTPPGAEALLDGKTIGKTPVRLDGICTGKHDVILRFPGVGQWGGTIDVSKGQRASLNQRPRLTIAYAGMLDPGPAGQAPAGEKELGEILAQLRTVNVVQPGRGLPEALIARKRTPGGADLSKEQVEAIAGATGADLVIVARPGEGGFGSKVEIQVLSAGSALPGLKDRFEISLDDKTQAKELLARLDIAPDLSAPWIGLEAIEQHRAPNPIVIRVQPGGPAAKAGAHIGDAVVSLGGKPVASPRDLRAALEALHEGAQASLMLQSPGAAPRQVNLAVGSTPVMLPPPKGGQIVSRLAAELSYRARLEAASGRPTSPERSAALLSLAVLLMDKGMYEAALKQALEPAQLPQAPGLSSGSASYLKGLCLIRLNRQAEAREQLTQAAGQPDASLWTHEGPPVAERARRLLQTP